MEEIEFAIVEVPFRTRQGLRNVVDHAIQDRFHRILLTSVL
jgi:hypothetical protein